MTDFEGHLRAGARVYGVSVAVAGIAYFGGMVHGPSLAAVVTTLPLTLAGALFPDLDHPASLTYRYGKRYLPLLVGAVALGIGLRHRGAVAATLAPDAIRAGAFLSGLVTASLAWGALTGTRWLLPRLRPPHRTATHRLSTGLIVALCVGAVIALLTRGSPPSALRVELVGSAAFFSGFVSHLLADDVLTAYRDRLLGRE